MPPEETHTVPLKYLAALRRIVESERPPGTDAKLREALKAMSSLQEYTRRETVQNLFKDLHAVFERHVTKPLQREITKRLKSYEIEELAEMAETCLNSQRRADFPKTDSLGQVGLNLCECIGWSPSKIEILLSENDLIQENSFNECLNLEHHVNLWLALLAWNAVPKGWVLCFAEDQGRVAWIEPSMFQKMSWAIGTLPPEVDEFQLTSWDKRIRLSQNANKLWFVPVLDLLNWQSRENLKHGPRGKARRDREKFAAGCIKFLAKSNPSARLPKVDALSALEALDFSEAAAKRIWSIGAPDWWRESGNYPKDLKLFCKEDLMRIFEHRLE